MIIVLQSIPEILAELKRLAQNKIDADRLAQVVFTSSHREALDYVRPCTRVYCIRLRSLR